MMSTIAYLQTFAVGFLLGLAALLVAARMLRSKSADATPPAPSDEDMAEMEAEVIKRVRQRFSEGGPLPGGSPSLNVVSMAGRALIAAALSNDSEVLRMTLSDVQSPSGEPIGRWVIEAHRLPDDADADAIAPGSQQVH